MVMIENMYNEKAHRPPRSPTRANSLIEKKLKYTLNMLAIINFTHF